MELRQDAAAQGIGEKALYMARRVEVVTVPTERIPPGRWVWALATDTRTGAKMAPHLVPEMFAKFAKFAKFARFVPRARVRCPSGRRSDYGSRR